MAFGNLLAYIGPEIIMPLLSFLAAALGVILLGWRWILALASKAFRVLLGRSDPGDESTTCPTERDDR